MPKATVSAKAATETAVAIKVSATVLAAIKASISADIARSAAVTASEQSIVKAGEAIRKGEFGSRAVADVSLRVLVIKEYEAANRSALYAGQQFARMLNIAYPGGKKATPTEAKKAMENLTAALTSGARIDSNKLQKLANGTARFDKKEKTIVNLTARTAHNTAAPLDAMTKAIENAITAASVAKLDAEQVMVAVVAALIACKMVDDAAEAKATIPDE